MAPLWCHLLAQGATMGGHKVCLRWLRGVTVKPHGFEGWQGGDGEATPGLGGDKEGFSLGVVFQAGVAPQMPLSGISSSAGGTAQGDRDIPSAGTALTSQPLRCHPWSLVHSDGSPRSWNSQELETPGSGSPGVVSPGARSQK